MIQEILVTFSETRAPIRQPLSCELFSLVVEARDKTSGDFGREPFIFTGPRLRVLRNNNCLQQARRNAEDTFVRVASRFAASDQRELVKKY